MLLYIYYNRQRQYSKETKPYHNVYVDMYLKLQISNIFYFSSLHIRFC